MNIKKYLIALAFLLPSLALADGELSLANGDAWTWYGFGNGSVIAEALTGIKGMVASASYWSLIGFMALIGFFGAAIAAAQTGRWTSVIGTFVALTMVMSIGIRSTATVVVVDPINGSFIAVQDVPAIVAVPVSVVSMTGHEVTEIIETFFSTPGVLQVSGGGTINMAASLIQDSTKIHLDDPSIRATMAAFSHDCIVPSMAGGWINGHDLIQSEQLFGPTGTLKNINGALLTTIHTGEAEIVTYCGEPLSPGETITATSTRYSAVSGKNAYEYISTYLQYAYPEALARSAGALHGTPAYAWLEGALTSSQSFLMGSSLNQPMGQTIQQAAAINLLQPAMIQSAMSTGDTALATSLALAQAEKSQESGWAMAAQLFQDLAGYIYSLLQVLLTALMPVMVAAMFIPGAGRKLAMSVLAMFIWLALWEPTMAIINQIMIWYAMGPFGGSLGGAGTYTMENIGPVSQMGHRFMLAGGFMAASVPMITLSMVKGGLNFGSMLGGAFGSAVSSKAGETASTGNINLGNTQMDNMAMDQFNLKSQTGFGFGAASGGIAGAGSAVTAHVGGYGADIAGNKVTAQQMQQQVGISEKEAVMHKKAASEGAQQTSAAVASEVASALLATAQTGSSGDTSVGGGSVGSSDSVGEQATRALNTGIVASIGSGADIRAQRNVAQQLAAQLGMKADEADKQTLKMDQDIKANPNQSADEFAEKFKVDKAAFAGNGVWNKFKSGLASAANGLREAMAGAKVTTDISSGTTSNASTSDDADLKSSANTSISAGGSYSSQDIASDQRAWAHTLSNLRQWSAGKNKQASDALMRAETASKGFTEANELSTAADRTLSMARATSADIGFNNLQDFSSRMQQLQDQSKVMDREAADLQGLPASIERLKEDVHGEVASAQKLKDAPALGGDFNQRLDGARAEARKAGSEAGGAPAALNDNAAEIEKKNTSAQERAQKVTDAAQAGNRHLSTQAEANKAHVNREMESMAKITDDDLKKGILPIPNSDPSWSPGFGRELMENAVTAGGAVFLGKLASVAADAGAAGAAGAAFKTIADKLKGGGKLDASDVNSANKAIFDLDNSLRENPAARKELAKALDISDNDKGFLERAVNKMKTLGDDAASGVNRMVNATSDYLGDMKAKGGKFLDTAEKLGSINERVSMDDAAKWWDAGGSKAFKEKFGDTAINKIEKQAALAGAGLASGLLTGGAGAVAGAGIALYSLYDNASTAYDVANWMSENVDSIEQFAKTGNFQAPASGEPAATGAPNGQTGPTASNTTAVAGAQAGADAGSAPATGDPGGSSAGGAPVTGTASGGSTESPADDRNVLQKALDYVLPDNGSSGLTHLPAESVGGNGVTSLGALRESYSDKVDPIAAEALNQIAPGTNQTYGDLAKSGQITREQADAAELDRQDLLNAGMSVELVDRLYPDDAPVAAREALDAAAGLSRAEPPSGSRGGSADMSSSDRYRQGVAVDSAPTELSLESR